MLSEISNKTWLEKKNVIRDFKYNLIRETESYQRFQISLYKRKIMLSEISNITWSEKQNVIKDFKYHLIREMKCYQRFQI